MADRAPPFYRFVASRSGQSEPLGAVFVIALTIMSASVIVVLGGAALDSTQESSEIQRAEHVMTLFDSRAATVALGDSDGQSLRLPESGQYQVREDTGWVRVRHTNYSDGNGEREELYNASLGSVVFESGDTTVAYQGGGVWRKDGSGNATMVSPPELHYRSATLTFPSIRVSGTGSVAGRSTAKIRPVQRAQKVFPNQSATYDGSPDRPYVNPAKNGSLSVTIKSDYYTAWGAYLRSRTAGNVTVDHQNETATVDLFTVGSRGNFQMPNDPDDASGGNDGLLVRGLEGDHNLDEFTITLVDDPDDSAKMNNLQWSMWAEEGQKQIELHLRDGTDDKVQATIYYSDDGGETYHGWKNETAFETVEKDVDDDGDDETVLEVDWTGNTSMSYAELSKSDIEHFDNPNSKDFVEPSEWDQHEEADVYKNDGSESESDTVSYVKTDTTHIGDATNHYFALMGSEFSLQVDDKNSDTVHEDSSSGNIDYPGSAKYITYLHVTENEIEVTLR